MSEIRRWLVRSRTMARRRRCKSDNGLFPIGSRLLEASLEDELDALTARLRKLAAPKVKSRRQARSEPRAVPSSPLARIALAGLRARGETNAKFVTGRVFQPGSAASAPHSWVESEDKVYDSTLGEGRGIWPRELYYLVFRAQKKEAA